MIIKKFITQFEKAFPSSRINNPSMLYGNWLSSFFFDPVRHVEGMASIKKQKLLNIAFSCLDADECYLEVGTYLGKSLIAAMLGNSPRAAFACDNFSEFRETSSFEKLMENLRKYYLLDKVRFFNADFQSVLNKDNIPLPIGVYFYDGAHDEESQYSGIKLAVPLFADEAIVIVDDWRFAPDSQSYAKAGTERAVAESDDEWKMLYELPARYNGDCAMWWNGIAVYAFKRRST